MNGPLLTSILINFLLFILLSIFLIVLVTNTDTSVQQPQNPVCPVVNPAQTLPPFQTQRPYVFKTLSGRFVQSCFGCLPTPVSCANQGMIASDDWNGDTVELVNAGNMFQIKLNSKLNPKGVYYLNMVRTNESNILCLTQNPNQQGAMFEIISYVTTSQMGSNLYQIGTPVSASLIGEADPSCLVQNGLIIQDGYNMSVNAPRGMDDRSFFLLLPAK